MACIHAMLVNGHISTTNAGADIWYEPIWNIIKPRCEKASITSDEEIMYYFIYFQAVFTMILKHWVDTGCQKEEAEIASIIKDCIPAVFREG